MAHQLRTATTLSPVLKYQNHKIEQDIVALEEELNARKSHLDHLRLSFTEEFQSLKSKFETNEAIWFEKNASRKKEIQNFQQQNSELLCKLRETELTLTELEMEFHFESKKVLTIESALDKEKEITTKNLRVLQNNINALEAELHQTENDEEILSLQERLRELDEEKVQLEDCIIGMRQQLPKLHCEIKHLETRIALLSQELQELENFAKHRRQQELNDETKNVTENQEQQRRCQKANQIAMTETLLSENTPSETFLQLESSPVRKRGRPRKTKLDETSNRHSGGTKGRAPGQQTRVNALRSFPRITPRSSKKVDNSDVYAFVMEDD